MILHFRVFAEESLDIVEFLLRDMSSADRTSLMLVRLILDLASELILFLDSCHIPIPIQANQVESVEALVDSH